ncbi:hypothetical protein [Helicobacter bizzozeronii]|uniref:hypothetical protein n=1 Tax=Helicobacter bizzozeronii TaxID=56877 RepID=UPI000CF12EE2|nr:hypothetical protein [Helicobacter bizzozeronii]
MRDREPKVWVQYDLINTNNDQIEFSSYKKRALPKGTLEHPIGPVHPQNKGKNIHFPKIFFYKEEKLKCHDLRTTYEELHRSNFFVSLFKILKDINADIDIDYVRRAHEEYMLDLDNEKILDHPTKTINALLETTIGKRFNTMFQSIKTENKIIRYSI